MELKRVHVRALRWGLTGKVWCKPRGGKPRYYNATDLALGQQISRKEVEFLLAEELLENRDDVLWTTEKGREALEADDAACEKIRATAASHTIQRDLYANPANEISARFYARD